MNRRTENTEGDDAVASNVVPLPLRLAAWEPVGDLVAAVVMRCRGKITLIERQSGLAWEEETNGTGLPEIAQREEGLRDLLD